MAFNPSSYPIPGPGKLTLVWTGPVMPELGTPQAGLKGRIDMGESIPTVTIGLNMRTVDAKHREETMRIIEEASWKFGCYKVRWQHAAMAQLSTFATVDQAKKFIDEELSKFLE